MCAHFKDMTYSYATPVLLYDIVHKLSELIKHYSTLPFGVNYEAFFSIKISQLMS